MSKVETVIKANSRENLGTGSARATRKEGNIPAVLYGGKEGPVHLSVDLGEFLREYNRGYITSRLYDLDIDGKTTKVLPKQVQVHPVTDVPLHVDFMRVNDNQKVKVKVPVKFKNIEKSPGIKRGGVLNAVYREIEVICDSNSIPEAILVDLNGVRVGESIKSEKAEFPNGAVPTSKTENFTVATITGRGAKKQDDEEASSDEDSAEE